MLDAAAARKLPPDNWRPEASTVYGAEVVAALQINGWYPIAASVGIARTHHVDVVPAALGLDLDLIPIFVSPTVTGRDVSMEKPLDHDCDLSKRRRENLAVSFVAL